VPEVIALGISAIFRELLGKPEIRRPVKPRHEPIDHRLSDKVQPRDGGQRGWVEEAL
jgi:hypothetical protein